MTKADLQSPTDLGANANRDIPAALRALLADVFALYLKTKNFHWHVSGSHFRDYHLMLDEQADRAGVVGPRPAREEADGASDVGHRHNQCRHKSD